MHGPPPEAELDEVHYDLDLFARLFRFVGPYAFLFALALLASVLTAGFELYLPIITKTAIDTRILKQGYVYRAPSDAAAEQFRREFPGALSAGPRVYLVPRSGRAGVVHGADSILYYYLRQEETTPEQWQRALAVARRHAEFTIAPGTLLIAHDSKRDDLKILTGAEADALRDSDWHGLALLTVLFFTVLFGDLLANIALAILLQFIGQRVMRDLRMHLLDHVLGLSMSFYTKNPVGRLVTRLTNDVEALSEFYTIVLVTLFKDILLIGGIAFIIARFNPQLSLYVWGMTPFLVAITVAFRILARDAYRVIRRKIAEINAYIAESLSGVKVIKLFLREGENYRRFAKLNHEAYAANFRQVTIFSAFQPLINLMNYTAVALVIYFGGQKVLGNQLSVGAWVAFVSYVGMFFAPIADLAEKYNNFQGAMAAAEKLFTLLKVTERIPEPDPPAPIAQIRGAVEFKNVWHSYDDSQFVLEDVSFKVEPGQTVALVGPTGSGKTSITALILRFYDPVKGQILIDGVDARELGSKALRSAMAICQQDVFLFANDIKGNIRLHNEEITDEAVKEAAGAVNATPFIESLPRQFDEEVRERGATQSAGQRQLLAFARALAFNPRILILDEATANIDPETERLIQDALKVLLRGRTSIVVAHRLSTIKNADKILVLYKGRILEQGTHEELLSRRGFYYNLYRLQYAEV